MRFASATRELNAAIGSLQLGIGWGYFNGIGSPFKREWEPDQTFKFKTEPVEVRAVVTDRNGRLVEDLNKEDFELLEDGRPQEISFFAVSNLEQPNKADQHKTIQSGNVRERLSGPPARCTILYVDNLHLEFRYLSGLSPFCFETHLCLSLE